MVLILNFIREALKKIGFFKTSPLPPLDFQTLIQEKTDYMLFWPQMSKNTEQGPNLALTPPLPPSLEKSDFFNFITGKFKMSTN